MKKSIIAFASMGMLLMASCSSDELMQENNGTDGAVSFTVTLPDGIDSRAFSEAEAAKTLTYAVYEADSKEVVFSGTESGGREFSVNFNLVRGKHYDFVFWADKGDNALYKYDNATQTITIDYSKMAVNDDTADAFFNVVKGFEVTGAMTKEVQLRRPFAQINVGTSDLAAVTTAGSTISGTEITVDGAYTELNLITGIADKPEKVTIAAGELPEGETFPYQSDTYDYLGMVYVLTGIELEAADVQHTQSELFDIDVAINYSTEGTTNIHVESAPVQRNYRTNIFGALLTSPLNFSIIIEPDYFIPDTNLEGVEKGKALVNGKTYDTLAEAIAAATGENPEVKLGEGEFPLPTSLKSAGRNSITITGTNGSKVVYPADNKIEATDMEVAMNNLTFSTAQTSKYVGFDRAKSESYKNIQFVDGALYPMAKSVEISNSKFTVNPEATPDDAVKYTLRFQARGVQQTAVISDCEFTTHLNTAVTAYNSTADLTFNNCKFTNIENESRAASVKDAQSAISFANATPTGEFKYNLVINNCTAEGFLGHFLSDSKVWACKTGEMASVTIDGVSVHQPIVNPNNTKNYILYTPSALNVIAKIVNEGYWKDGELVINRLSGYTLLLNNDLDMTGVEFTPIGVGIVAYPGKNFAGTFDGQGHTISNLTASDFTVNHAAAGLFGGLVGVVKNLTLENPTISSSHYAGGIAGYVDNETGSLIDNCKVIGGTITATPELINGEWDNGDKVGGILGYGCVNVDKVTNCSVEGTTIKCYRHGGAVIGYLAGQSNLTGCSAKDVTLLWDGEHDYKNFGSVDKAPFGIIAGNITGEFNDNTATNVTLPQ